VGAQKAGTTSLYDWLGQHPEIDAPGEIKDHHFFTNDELFKKGSTYLEKFYAENDRIKIHGAVNYLYFCDVASDRIHHYNPDAKIIVCLRDPVDRAISAYKYFLRTLKESRTFSEALKRETNGELTTYQELANYSYISHGFYFEQINYYLKNFERGEIHFVCFDHLVDEDTRTKVMADLCGFIGCKNDFAFDFSHLNESATPRYKAINFILKNSVSQGIAKSIIPFRLRKKMAKTIEQANLSKKRVEVDIRREDIEFLAAIYKAKNSGLESLIRSS
jgi:hypothetical protein